MSLSPSAEQPRSPYLSLCFAGPSLCRKVRDARLCDFSIPPPLAEPHRVVQNRPVKRTRGRETK